MATLYFSGDQVAFFTGIGDATVSNKMASVFTGVRAPFLETDVVKIVVGDQYIGANGEFSTKDVRFSSISVIRDGVEYTFTVKPDSKIKPSGGKAVPDQGDSLFTTNDKIEPPTSGPFAGLTGGTMVFSTTNSFETGVNETIVRTQTLDLNADGDTTDTTPLEAGNANFNVTPRCRSPASPRAR